MTPARRGRGGRHARSADAEEPTPAERRASMTWAQRLKRVFGIDIETCSACGGALCVIGCIEEPGVITKILNHLNERAIFAGADLLPESRAPPQPGLFE